MLNEMYQRDDGIPHLSICKSPKGCGALYHQSCCPGASLATSGLICSLAPP